MRWSGCAQIFAHCTESPDWSNASDILNFSSCADDLGYFICRLRFIELHLRIGFTQKIRCAYDKRLWHSPKRISKQRRPVGATIDSNLLFCLGRFSSCFIHFLQINPFTIWTSFVNFVKPAKNLSTIQTVSILVFIQCCFLISAAQILVECWFSLFLDSCFEIHVASLCDFVVAVPDYALIDASNDSI